MPDLFWLLIVIVLCIVISHFTSWKLVKAFLIKEFGELIKKLKAENAELIASNEKLTQELRTYNAAKRS